jgi:hypothetical protein
MIALLAKTGSHYVILSGPARQGRVGHVISGFTWCKGERLVYVWLGGIRQPLGSGLDCNKVPSSAS